MQLENGKLYLNYGTKDQKLIGEVADTNLNTDKTITMLFSLGGDSFIVNGYMIHEVCEGEYAVYSPEQQKLEGEAAQNIDFPSFKYVTNAISYCLGFVNKYMLETESDLKLFLERNGK